jgi:VanZ family protein
VWKLCIKTARLKWLPVVLILLWMAFLLHLSSQTDPRAPLVPRSWPVAQLSHLILYGVLGILAHWLVIRWRLFHAKPLVGLFLAGLVGFLWGSFDEWYQSFTPGRDSSLGDTVIDGIGAYSGGVLVVILRLLLRPWLLGLLDLDSTTRCKTA